MREIQWSRYDLETGQPTQVYNNQDGVIDSENFAIEQSDGADSLEYFNLVVRIVTINSQDISSTTTMFLSCYHTSVRVMLLNRCRTHLFT